MTEVEFLRRARDRDCPLYMETYASAWRDAIKTERRRRRQDGGGRAPVLQDAILELLGDGRPRTLIDICLALRTRGIVTWPEAPGAPRPPENVRASVQTAALRLRRADRIRSEEFQRVGIWEIKT